MAFFAVEQLTVMVSSRCSDPVEFEGQSRPMTDVRRAMKAEFESIMFGGEPVFRVWIHEDEAVTPGDQSSWDTCMSRARKADVFLVLSWREQASARVLRGAIMPEKRWNGPVWTTTDGAKSPRRRSLPF